MAGLPYLLRKILVLLLFLALQTVAIVLMVNNSYFQQNAILQVVRKWQTSAWERRSSWIAFKNLRTLNDALSQENAALKEELARLSLLEHSLLAKKEIPTSIPDTFSFIPARVIRNSVNHRHNHLVIDKGLADGVRPDMGVIGSGGIAGVVSYAAENHALVISLLNTQQRFTAEHKETGTFGTLRWNGVHYKKIQLSEIPQHTKVTKGDTIISSPFSLIFPDGIPLGTVLSQSQKRGTSLELEIELFLDFKTLRYVQVVSRVKEKELQQIKQKEEEAL
ncbi:MAG TPA: rod shape-determining protein MreC [Bacteroidales bacterium]|jgi:rod shape-determining protein MreC|nr:rod shape-determining protein MreC [Bacteroidales bacterium]